MTASELRGATTYAPMPSGSISSSTAASTSGVRTCIYERRVTSSCDHQSCLAGGVYLPLRVFNFEGISSAWLFSGGNITVSILSGTSGMSAETGTNQISKRGCALLLTATRQDSRVTAVAILRHFRPKPPKTFMDWGRATAGAVYSRIADMGIR